MKLANHAAASLLTLVILHSMPIEMLGDERPRGSRQSATPQRSPNLQPIIHEMEVIIPPSRKGPQVPIRRRLIIKGTFGKKGERQDPQVLKEQLLRTIFREPVLLDAIQRRPSTSLRLIPIHRHTTHQSTQKKSISQQKSPTAPRAQVPRPQAGIKSIGHSQSAQNKQTAAAQSRAAELALLSRTTNHQSLAGGQRMRIRIKRPDRPRPGQQRLISQFVPHLPEIPNALANRDSGAVQSESIGEESFSLAPLQHTPPSTTQSLLQNVLNSGVLTTSPTPTTTSPTPTTITTTTTATTTTTSVLTPPPQMNTPKQIDRSTERGRERPGPPGFLPPSNNVVDQLNNSDDFMAVAAKLQVNKMVRERQRRRAHSNFVLKRQLER